MPEVNWIATVTATVLAFFLGAIWYGPLFGKAWIEENNITPEKMEQLKKNFKPGKMYGGTLVINLISAYIFGIFVGHHPGISFAMGSSLTVGFFLVATSFASTYLWESRSLRHWMLNGGYHTARFALIGLSFGLLG